MSRRRNVNISRFLMRDEARLLDNNAELYLFICCARPYRQEISRSRNVTPVVVMLYEGLGPLTGTRHYWYNMPVLPLRP